MKLRPLTGTLTALVTPFRNQAVAHDDLRKLVEFQIKSGVNGLVPVGTTGESPTLSHEEHLDVVRAVIEASRGRVPVVAGTGSNSTQEAVDLTSLATGAGADPDVDPIAVHEIERERARCHRQRQLDARGGGLRAQRGTGQQRARREVVRPDEIAERRRKLLVSAQVPRGRRLTDPYIGDREVFAVDRVAGRHVAAQHPESLGVVVGRHQPSAADGRAQHEQDSQQQSRIAPGLHSQPRGGAGRHESRPRVIEGVYRSESNSSSPHPRHPQQPGQSRSADTRPCQTIDMADSSPRFLTLADVADVLNVTARQVYALVRTGDLRGIQIGGRGQWRIESVELEQYIQRQYERTDQLIAEEADVDESVNAD